MPIAKARNLRGLKRAAQLAADGFYGQTGFKAISGLCTIKQFFSIREPDVAQMVSDMYGQKSAANISENAKGESISAVGIPIIRPEKGAGAFQVVTDHYRGRCGQPDSRAAYYIFQTAAMEQDS